MKNYSLKEIILTALITSLLIAAIINSSFFGLATKASFFDFWGEIPFLNKFFKKPDNSRQLIDIKTIIEQRKGDYTPVEEYESRVIKVVKKASPAVVSITITKNVPIIEQYYSNPFGNDPLFKQFFGDQFQIPQYRQKGVQKQEVGGGSGFIISTNGLILTNKHVVSDTEAEYTVFTNDGKKYTAQVLARDSIQDLAIIKINIAGLPTIPLADSDRIEVGQTAIAIGNALGEFRNTVNVGVVSGVGRTIVASGDNTTETLQDVIQTDTSINPGNSGGPLLNLKGEVIGINTAIVSSAQSIGFAIPINKAKRDINDVVSKGKILTPYLGVRYIVITSALQEEKKLPFDYGALITKSDKGEAAVISGSPADKAGVKEGDIILEFGLKRLDKDHQLGPLIVLYSVGESIPVKIWRNGQTLNLNIVLAERP